MIVADREMRDRGMKERSRIVRRRGLRDRQVLERLGVSSRGLKRDPELQLALQIIGVERDNSVQMLDRRVNVIGLQRLDPMAKQKRRIPLVMPGCPGRGRAGHRGPRRHWIVVLVFLHATLRLDAAIHVAPVHVTREMAGDEVVHVEPRWPRPAVTIMAFEVEGALVRDKVADRIDQEAIGGARFGRKGIDDDAVAFTALIVAQPGAALDPLFRQSPGRDRPAEEPLDPAIRIDDEEEVSAGDLIEEN